MIAEIESKLNEIQTLCEQYRVSRLELFGSAARDDFDPINSDFDFLVEFIDQDTAPDLVIRFFEFNDAVGQLFDRKAEVHSARSPRRNTSMWQVIDRDRMAVYEADGAGAIR